MIKINGIEIKKEYFPDGTFNLLNFPLENLYNNTVNVNNIIEWRFENNEEQILLYYLNKHIKSITNNELWLCLPYLPNARMDRTYSNKEIFTLKWFCEFINDLKFNKIYVQDIHSDVSLALLNNLVHFTLENYIEYVINKVNPDILLYPDNGSAKKYSKFIKYPYLFGNKKRDWNTGKILEFEILGNIPKKDFNVLIVDDICSKGGTFYHAAKKLKEIGANKIWLYITHCEDSILDGELINSKLLEKIYTTDSIFTKQHELIEIIGV